MESGPFNAPSPSHISWEDCGGNGARKVVGAEVLLHLRREVSSSLLCVKCDSFFGKPPFPCPLLVQEKEQGAEAPASIIRMATPTEGLEAAPLDAASNPPFLPTEPPATTPAPLPLTTTAPDGTTPAVAIAPDGSNDGGGAAAVSVPAPPPYPHSSHPPSSSGKQGGGIVVPMEVETQLGGQRHEPVLQPSLPGSGLPPGILEQVNILIAKDDHVEAIKVLEDHTNHLKHLKGHDPLEAASTYKILSGLYEKTGDVDKYIDSMERCAEVYRTSHPDAAALADVLTTLARACSPLPKYQVKSNDYMQELTKLQKNSNLFTPDVAMPGPPMLPPPPPPPVSTTPATKTKAGGGSDRNQNRAR